MVIKFEKLVLLSANFGEESSLPPIAEKLSLDAIKNDLFVDESDGLFINYGAVSSSFPYRYQDMYDRALEEKEYETVVLENEFLRAEFVPSLGGKLWSLIDKNTGRELLFKNSVVRPCNLAVRNAWLSGGVEWNCGFKGHHPYTCSEISTAITSLEDGTPVLRFYYFERIRSAVVQMDFFLPDGERQLYARMRITNPNPYVVPMYWWSNIAVTEKNGDRVIVPADRSYTANEGNVLKIDIPVHNRIDVTYPAKNITANDYFWDLRRNARRYICCLDADGYGLCQTSTSMLRGRKLFVWGDSQGGHKWMNFLTKDSESGRYCEIQCGLARTQYECLPMPPYTVWEWIEAYGAMQADSSKIHGSWAEAQAESELRLDMMIGEERLETLLDETRTMAKSPAEKVIKAVEGWGALERLRCGKDHGMMCEHLDFGKTGEEQAVWISLLEQGTVGEHFPDEVPGSYNIRREWLDMLETAAKGKDSGNWYTHYLIGCTLVAKGEYARAMESLDTSLKLCDTAWANYAFGVAMSMCGQDESGYMLRAYRLRPGDISIAKAVFKSLHTHESSDTLISLFENASDEIRGNARCRLYYAYALARVGRIAEAERVICPDGGYLVVPDIRECELTITQLWVYIQEQKGFTRETMGEIPRDLDFRMFAKREGWF